MLQPTRRITLMSAAVVAGLLVAPGIGLCDDGPWRIAKVSGDAWIAGDTVRPASVSDSALLRAGDSIRTGRNGRVLLSRGAESILVSPNSAITLPAAGKPGMSTLVQRAGTILVDVEKRNVQHFEVETPYLAAVVKGTRFRVSLESGRASVEVERGRVQVADFKTGESALVLPGQSARAGANVERGLQLAGRGTLSPIEHGAPRAPRIAPLNVPKGGFGPLPGSVPLRAPTLPGPGDTGGLVRGPNGVLRITAPIGEISLDVHTATNGVARSERQGSVGAARSTVWSTGDLNPGTNAGKNRASNSGNPTGAAEAILGAIGVSRISTDSSTSTLTATADGGGAVAASGKTTGPGNGTTGNGNGTGSGTAGSGSGDSGNGKGGTTGNGNSTGSGTAGNGNGNSGNGNGNGGGTGSGSNGNGNGNNGNGNGNSGSAGSAGTGNGNGNNGNGGSTGSGTTGNGKGNNGNGNGNGGSAGSGSNGNGNGNNGNGNGNGGSAGSGSNGNGKGNNGNGNGNGGGAGAGSNGNGSKRN